MSTIILEDWIFMTPCHWVHCRGILVFAFASLVHVASYDVCMCHYGTFTSLFYMFTMLGTFAVKITMLGTFAVKIIAYCSIIRSTHALLPFGAATTVTFA